MVDHHRNSTSGLPKTTILNILIWETTTETQPQICKNKQNSQYPHMVDHHRNSTSHLQKTNRILNILIWETTTETQPQICQKQTEFSISSYGRPPPKLNLRSAKNKQNSQYPHMGDHHRNSTSDLPKINRILNILIW